MIYASGYDKEPGALSAMVERALTDDLLHGLTEKVRKATNDATQEMLNSFGEDVVNTLTDYVRDTARRQAERMLEEAITGNEKVLLNLLGVHWHSNRPNTYWDFGAGIGTPRKLPWGYGLIQHIAEKHPDIIRNELVKQLEAETTAYRNEAERLAKSLRDLQAKITHRGLWDTINSESE